MARPLWRSPWKRVGPGDLRGKDEDGKVALISNQDPGPQRTLAGRTFWSASPPVRPRWGVMRARKSTFSRIDFSLAPEPISPSP